MGLIINPCSRAQAFITTAHTWYSKHSFNVITNDDVIKSDIGDDNVIIADLDSGQRSPCPEPHSSVWRFKKLFSEVSPRTNCSKPRYTLMLALNNSVFTIYIFHKCGATNFAAVLYFDVFNKIAENTGFVNPTYYFDLK